MATSVGMTHDAARSTDYTTDYTTNSTTHSTSGPSHESEARPKPLRGFAAMDPDRQREIARRGGRAAHERGTAHEFTPREARIAGSKGGKVISRNREHMATIGRRGGKARVAPTT